MYIILRMYGGPSLWFYYRFGTMFHSSDHVIYLNLDFFVLSVKPFAGLFMRCGYCNQWRLDLAPSRIIAWTTWNENAHLVPPGQTNYFDDLLLQQMENSTSLLKSNRNTSYGNLVCCSLLKISNIGLQFVDLLYNAMKQISLLNWPCLVNICAFHRNEICHDHVSTNSLFTSGS